MSASERDDLDAFREKRKEREKFMTIDTRKSSSILLLGAALAAITSALTGCSQQAFVVTNSIQEQLAPGTFIVPAKVDILLAQDDTGSMKEVHEKIAQQMPGFLRGLEAKHWDFHFATIPLAGTRALDQITASKHDSNYGSLWTPPYPGASPNAPGMIQLFFRPLDQYTGFLRWDELSNSTNGNEEGFENIRRTLITDTAGTGFLRQDAMLVVIVVGNGEDTSGIDFCNRGDGYMVPCSGSAENSFQNYKSTFLGLKGSQQMVRFYSAVSTQYRYKGCFGQTAYAGARYMRMATDLGGEAYDVCSQPVDAILGSLDRHLTNTQLQFRTRYLFIDSAPNVDSIVVTKYIGGDPNRAEIIPQDATNGWTYLGWRENIAAIDWPAEMNRATGYAIELHGSAKLVGNDRATVSFRPFGAVDSVSR